MCRYHLIIVIWSIYEIFTTQPKVGKKQKRRFLNNNKTRVIKDIFLCITKSKILL